MLMHLLVKFPSANIDAKPFGVFFFFFCFFFSFFFLRLGLGQGRAVVIIGRWLLPSLVDTGDICCHYWQHILVLQGHLSNFKVARLYKLSNLTQIGRFRTVTPVWIHWWLWNDAQSLKQHRRGALLFFKGICQISRSHGTKNCRFWPKLSVSGL